MRKVKNYAREQDSRANADKAAQRINDPIPGTIHIHRQHRYPIIRPMRRRIFALRFSVSGLRYQIATLVQYLQKRLCLDHGRETSMQTTEDQQHWRQLPRTQPHLPSPYICTPRTVRHESHLINMTHKLKYLKSNVLMTCIAKHGYQVTKCEDTA